MTVMSKECAERRGLMSELDTRFAGKAVGVGSTRILGRINDAHIKYVLLQIHNIFNVVVAIAGYCYVA